MQTRDKISVITTVYNTRIDWLEDCVNSVQNQTYTNHEHIIVDDGSTNADTIEYLKALHTQDNRIIVIFQDCNKGIGASRNRGINEATGEFICFLDSDDYYKLDYLENLYNPIIADDTINIVIASGVTCVDENKNYIKETLNNFTNTDDLLLYYTAQPGYGLFLKSILKKNNVYFPEERKIYEDNVFSAAAVTECRNRAGINCNGYVNRVNTQSFSHSTLFTNMTYDLFPNEYIKNEILERSKKHLTQDCKENSIIISSCLVIYATAMLFLTRNCNFDIKKDVLKQLSNDIRNMIKSRYLFFFKINFKDRKDRYLMRFLYYGLAVALYLKVDIVYSLLVHKLIQIIDKSKSYRHKRLH